MITLNESHFILVMILVSLITYIIHSYYIDCSIDCKINYYKYENYHDKKKEPEPQNIHSIMAKKNESDITEKLLNDYGLPFKEDIQSTNIGDRSSSHNSTIQSTHFDAVGEDNEYINKLFKGLY